MPVVPVGSPPGAGGEEGSAAMADAARARRLAKRIVTIVATELEHQVKDPRLAMVTITAARVTPDLRDATVFYTVYGDETAAQSSAAALASATGVLRSAVGRQTGVRFTPTLQFRPDIVPEQSRHIEELLVAARASDAELAQRAAGATFAGDPDPYRQPREAADDDDDLDDDDLDEFDIDESDLDETDEDARHDDGVLTAGTAGPSDSDSGAGLSGDHHQPAERP